MIPAGMLNEGGYLREISGPDSRLRNEGPSLTTNRAPMCGL